MVLVVGHIGVMRPYGRVATFLGDQDVASKRAGLIWLDGIGARVLVSVD